MYTKTNILICFVFIISESKCHSDDFKDKVIIVTGSSSGVGAVTAEYFANLSASVVVTGRNEVRLQDVAKTVEAARGIKPLVVKADLTKDNEAKRLVDETIKKFGRIDVLINNAAVVIFGQLQDGIDIFDETLKTNLRTAYLLTSLAAPYLIKTKGNVINVSSINSMKGFPGYLAYGISKAGLDAFTKGVARELNHYGVRVNSVNPGPVNTGFPELSKYNKKQFLIILQETIRSNPLAYISSPKDVAELIIFLASDKAKSITGSVFLIDKGYLLQ